MVEVVITQARAGLTKAYKAGQRVLLPAPKAEIAVRNKWAVYAEKKAAPEPAAKLAFDTVGAVLKHFKGDKEAMKAYAKKEGIYIHSRASKAETIAEKILEAKK